MKRIAETHWGMEWPYRIIGFSDDTAELQKMNDQGNWICVWKSSTHEIILSNLVWLSGCNGLLNGYRELNERKN